MSKKQIESTSKRQLRKEEIRRKERQQKVITLGFISVIALVLVALIVIPSVQKAANPAGEFNQITPQAYPNENGTKLGDPNAKVSIQLFEDFQCSACEVYHKQIEPDVINRIIATGMAYYEFYQYPFMDDRSVQKDSDRAAMASECAAEQNRFWDYKSMLYNNRTGIQGQFSDIRLEAFAESLNLDLQQFNSCIQSGKYQSKIDADLSLGAELGVNGTPSLFVNGIEASPGQVPTFERIMEIVQQELQSN